MVYGTYNELVTGAYKPTNITGGPHMVYILTCFVIHKSEAWYIMLAPPVSVVTEELSA